jgi:hypothetical protein
VLLDNGLAKLPIDAPESYPSSANDLGPLSGLDSSSLSLSPAPHLTVELLCGQYPGIGLLLNLVVARFFIASFDILNVEYASVMTHNAMTTGTYNHEKFCAIPLLPLSQAGPPPTLVKQVIRNMAYILSPLKMFGPMPIAHDISTSPCIKTS